VPLPQEFSDLEPFVVDWALPTRAQRYEARLSKPFDELVNFYDAVAPRAEEAIGYLNGLDIDDLPDDATTLLHLLYSMIMVSFPVECWKQPRVPDSGAATLDCVSEPVP